MSNMFSGLKGQAHRQQVARDPSHPAHWPQDDQQYLNRCVGPCGGILFIGYKRRALCRICDPAATSH